MNSKEETYGYLKKGNAFRTLVSELPVATNTTAASL